MLTKQSTSIDFAQMLDQLLEAGHKPAEFYAGALTAKMVYAYRRGAQPLHWRGERILSYWCRVFGKERDQAPMCELVRGHRVDRRVDNGPRLQDLPAWPVAVPVTPRRKPGPKPKVRVEA